MSQNNTVVQDGTGAQVLTKLNQALSTINTLHAGSSAPTLDLELYMLWADTGNMQLKMLTNLTGPVWTVIGLLAANLGFVPLAGDSTINGNLTLAASKKIVMTSGAIDEDKGADIASASTTNIAGASGNYLDVTGAVTITALGTAQAGVHRTIRFTGALTFTHNATSLIIPGAQNITTAAGDMMTLRSLGGGNWLLVTYTKGDGSVWEIQAPNLAITNGTTNLAGTVGNYVVLTNASGTNAISALGTAPAGVRKDVTFSISGGSVSITHNATSLILPGAANMPITDGASATFRSLGSGNWRMTGYQPNSLAARIWSVVAQATASYTVVTADYGKYFIWEHTADSTATMPTIGTVGSGFIVAFRNANTNNAKLTLARASTDTLEGLTSIDLGVGSGVTYISDTSVSPNMWRRFESGITSVAGATYNTAVEILSSGSFTVPANVYQGRIRTWGGGGGGGGGGGSHSANGYAGGTGATGGTTSFGALISATGGVGGTGGQFTTAGTGGAGGTGIGGGTNITGGVGGAGSAGSSYTAPGAGGGGGSSGGEAPVATGGAAASGTVGGNGAANSNNLPSGGVAGGARSYSGASGADVLGTGTAATYYQSGAGGGGGGASANGDNASYYASGGGGGGAGGYAIGTFALTPGAIHTTTIGLGGGGGGGASYTTAGSNGSGGVGGNGASGSNGGAANTGGGALSTTVGAGGGGCNAGGGGSYTGGSASASAGSSVTAAVGTNGAGGGGGASSGGAGGGAGATPGGGGGGGGGSTYVSGTYGGGGGGGGGSGRIIVEYNV